MVYVNKIDRIKVELDHLQFLKGSEYDFSCSNCGQMYRKEIDECEQCYSKSFIPTSKLIQELELIV